MADTLIGATIKIALETAVVLASDRISMVYGLKKDLETFKESVAMILAFLADAEEKQPKQQAVKLWLRRLHGVACDANNVLNELNYHSLRRSKKNGDQLQGKVRFLFPFNSISRWRIAREIKKINLKLETINKEANSFGLNTRMGGGPNATSSSAKPMETDSILGQNVVGRANDASYIVQQLLNPAVNKVSVIPIVGMGGLGKTTLAKLIYNDQLIRNHFGKRIWVSVPENFEATHLLELILNSLTSGEVKAETRVAIGQKISKELDGVERYLLVLDDVWNESPTLWDDFFQSLVGVSSPQGGNWCIVTTRQQQVASVVSQNPPYLLEKLSDNDCWSILKEKALDGKEVPIELEALRKDITGRCHGLPLAASAIGGLLRIRKKEEWLSILDNGLLNLRNEYIIMQILKLSFDHLPSPAIKKCFLYCSLFGKDFDIEREQLIQLWMAEGYLQPDLDNEMAMEEIGISYFNILLQSSLLQEVREGKDLYGRMHDLVHDLVLSILRSESYDDFGTSPGDRSSQVSHLLLNSSGKKPDKNLKDISRSLGAFFLESAISDDLLAKFKYLRILNLSWACLAELPYSIGKLKLLRYLDLSGSTFKTLPESICRLYHLQTLRIIACPYLTRLPVGMSELINLRHLHIDHSEKIPMPLHMGRLSFLQTLEFFNIGERKGSQIEELGCLKDLKGRLHIRNLHLVNSTEEAEQANLSGKIKVFELVFSWPSYCSDPEDVLEGLQPQPNLQALVIDNYRGHRLPAWFMNLSASLSKLVRLSLECQNCQEIPAFGELQFLEELQLNGLKNICRIGHSFYTVGNSISSCDQVKSRTLFPALKILKIRHMENLMAWESVEASLETGEAVEVFPMLERLAIQDCPQLLTVPGHFPSLKELEIANVDRVFPIKQMLSMVTTLLTLSIEGVVELSCISDVLAEQNNHSLKHLTLKNCSNLRHLQCAGISVLRLHIQNCENLVESPKDLLTCQSLKELSIEECPKLGTIVISDGQQPFSSLQFLRISHSKGLHSLPSNLLESCTSLRGLEVYSCNNLHVLPLDFQQSPSISVLNLSKCPNLTTMPKGFGCLTNLRELTIGPFSESSVVDWLAISLLPVHQLRLFGLPQLGFIPDQLQYLASLHELHLYDFGLQALPEWFGKLESLEQLCLENCTMLLYFPSLSAMRSLTKLRSVRISQCRQLGGRCRRWSGPNSEWSKISHIPDFVIR